MRLELNTLYHAKLKDMSFGVIPKDVLIDIVSSGRICGVLLETEIAYRFEGVVSRGQGKGPDLIDDRLGTIQAKTYHHSDHEGIYTRGVNKGLPKSQSKKIFTTKSGLWDSLKRRKSLGENVEEQIESYFDDYDKFCYIDISKMKNLEFSFIVVSSEMPKNNHCDGNISLDDIMNSVEKEVSI
jgi:hypothetical protein